MRTLIPHEPYLPSASDCSWIEQGIWPCSWVAAPVDATSPISAFRLRFSMVETATVRAHVTADERYELFVDGVRVGRGPERGDPQHWFFETYDIPLSAGEHTIVAMTWALGAASLRSQMSVAPGFLFSPDDEKFIALLGTGRAAWEVKSLQGYELLRPFPHDFFSVGYGIAINGAAADWDWTVGGGEGWQPAKPMHPGSSATLRNRYAPTVHLLQPATLPPMLEKERTAGRVRYISDALEGAVDAAQSLTHESPAWTALFNDGVTLEIPAHTTRRVIVDLEDYVCAFPTARLRGGDGGMFQMFWAESLFHEQSAQTKGNRSEIEGKYFVGYGDRFFPSGPVARVYETFYWHSGRYLEIVVQTAAEPLFIERCGLLSTRYPLEPEMAFSASDETLAAMMPLGIRALQSSSHDSFIDGPYYEQMLWLGDSVQNSLTTHVLTRDDRLIRKTLRIFDSSRLPSGLTTARWPARDRLYIAPYSLLWIAIIRDYAFWKDDPAFIQSLLPGVRAVVNAFLGFINAQGLVVPTMGWNFIDWVPGWPDGMPPIARGSANGILNWQLVRTLGYVAELEECAGEFEMAARARRRADEITRSIETHFWDSQRGLFADDPEKTSFSEHAQAEAVLSGCLSPDKLDVLRRTLFEDAGLSRTTISYSHYLFEAYRKLGRVDALLKRFDLWRGLPELGLFTTPEGPEPTRSDCHAWGAHPIYHFFASVLGIHPGSFGFRTVEFAPQLGLLSWARGTMPHPRGEITAEVKSHAGSVRGRITLPEGVTGTLHLENETRPLGSGTTEF